jgi:hypothetical protein
MTEPELSEILTCSNCGDPIIAGDAIMVSVGLPGQTWISCESAACREMAASIIEVPTDILATQALDED